MYKHSLKIFRTGVAVAALLFVINSCSDAWDYHYDANYGMTSDQTLWEQLSSNADLTDFTEIVSKTNVYSNHEVSSVSYEDIFSSDQSFTVWAPVNGSFNKDSLLALCLTNAGDSAVEKGFIKNHIARYPYTVSSSTNKEVLLLNRKVKRLSGFTMGNVAIITPNIVSKNGMLHKISDDIPFFYNVYEGICSNSETSALGSYFKAYQKDSLDEVSSVASGIVDGKTVYVDSVLIETNALLTEFGYLNHEDSVYWMIAPTNNAWEEAYKKIAPYYNFSFVDEADSLQDYWTKNALIYDLVYNANLQASVSDSLISTKYDSDDPRHHVFYKPYTSGGILSEVTSTIECSNGYIYQVAKWPFTPQEVFFLPVKVEAEREANITDYTLCSFNVRRVAGDSISKNAYLDVVPSKSSSNPTVTLEIANTLSGKYDVCVVCVPKTVYSIPTNASDSATCFRPYKFKATLNYVDETGTSKSFNCGGGAFTNNPYVVDTVCVAKAFEFPTCNYKQDNVTVSLKLQCYVTSKETTTYSREMFIDCIYLIPREE